MIVKFMCDDVELRFGHVVCYCYNEEKKTLCMKCAYDLCGKLDRYSFRDVTEVEVTKEGGEE